MKQQVAFFKAKHGSCDSLTQEQISEDSIEFRRRWSEGNHENIEHQD